MHPPKCLARVILSAFLLLLPATIAPPALAAASHVVISEFATRGPASATDEFVELYNPTSSAISLAGWHLQYKSATGTTWSDRAVLPANASIAAHGFYLIANQTYAGAVAPDFTSGSWGSGTGMADNGHEQLTDASLVTVDLVGWGSAIAPEGGVAAPNHGTTANNNSVERKALATSTADSLAAGGAHAMLGNGQDTDVNGSDFVTQTHGRDPQNTLSPIEPAFATGGNGTGSVVVSPATVFTSQALASLDLAFHQDSSYTVTDVAITVPAAWTWSHLASDVVLGGGAFDAAVPTVVGDTIFVSNAALSPGDDGSVSLLGTSSPGSKGAYAFPTRTAVAAGTLTPLPVQPSVRVLELVPIVSLHVNDANGVAAAPYAVGAEATVTGIVTANLSTTRTDVYVQDGTGGVDLFNAAISPIPLDPGDSITVTGTILQFRGITELQPDFALLVKHAAGRPVPEPMLVTCAAVNATFQPDFTEPNEGRLVRINGGTYNATTSTLTDASGTTTIFIPTSFPAVPAVFDAIGILKQFKPGTPAPGPPYTADYELAPRTPDDIIPHPGPIFLTTPFEDQLQPNSVRIRWTTDVASTSVVRYGLTPALGDSVEDTNEVTDHALVLPGLQPSTVYDYAAVSTDVNGSNASPTSLFCTASPPQASGTINAYFNKSVDASLAWLHPANGNSDLPAHLIARIDAAHRSIDAAIYSMSGTVGGQVATALINARNRGVKVRIVCEYDNSSGSGFTTLTGAGIPLINDRFDPANGGLGLMHNKFFVIDGRGGAPESIWVWTGSWNLTDPGTGSDLQNAIEIQDPSLAVAYTMEFEEMWGSSTETPNAAVSRFGAHKLDNTPHRFSIGGRDVESWFSPSDGTNSHILSTINGAAHTLAFEQLTITRSDLANALIARKAAGLKVRGDLDNSSDTGSEYTTLVSGGVDVHVKSGYSGLLHHKYLVADGDDPHWNGTVLTGSHNWSAAAENSNNENTLIVHDPDLANQYLQEFSARYLQFGGTDSVHVSAVGPPTGRVLALSAAFPNPVRGASRIEYSLPQAAAVALRLFDVQGRVVRTLVDARQPAGHYQAVLSARGLAAGVYLCRLEAGGERRQVKVMLLR
jgi:phosphatidylserine/phosphatidylglycerophosphate/cardiolipin synthase-like enzyme